MYESEQRWRDVDRYFIESLVDEGEALTTARETSHASGLPDHEITPNQGKFLSLLCLMVRATRVLEFGTLGGYSTIWFAQAVGPKGHVTTLEMDPRCAEVARRNFEQAGVAERVDLRLGPAAEAAQELIDQGTKPFDVIFIDADKPNNSVYLAASLALSRPGTIIIGDNVVRDGAVTDPRSDDPRVRGSRDLIECMGQDSRLAATALQTVGLKGWDGFAIAVVR